MSQFWKKFEMKNCYLIDNNSHALVKFMTDFIKNCEGSF